MSAAALHTRCMASEPMVAIVFDAAEIRLTAVIFPRFLSLAIVLCLCCRPQVIGYRYVELFVLRCAGSSTAHLGNLAQFSTPQTRGNLADGMLLLFGKFVMCQSWKTDPVSGPLNFQIMVQDLEKPRL